MRGIGVRTKWQASVPTGFSIVARKGMSFFFLGPSIEFHPRGTNWIGFFPFYLPHPSRYCGSSSILRQEIKKL